jgi:YHS domain-containing protein
MMRGMLVVVWVLLLGILVFHLLRRRPWRWARARGAPAVLVKDPVCQVYIVQSRALTRVDNGVLHHFCSAECARQFSHGSFGSRR